MIRFFGGRNQSFLILAAAAVLAGCGREKVEVPAETGWTEVKVVDDAAPLAMEGDLPFGLSMLGWSPDGSLLAVSKVHDVYLVSVPGGQVDVVRCPAPVIDHIFDWRPDGKRFVAGLSNIELLANTPVDEYVFEGPYLPNQAQPPAGPVVEMDVDSGEVTRYWHRDTFGNTPGQAEYVLDGETIAVGVSGSGGQQTILGNRNITEFRFMTGIDPDACVLLLGRDSPPLKLETERSRFTVSANGEGLWCMIGGSALGIMFRGRNVFSHRGSSELRFWDLRSGTSAYTARAHFNPMVSIASAGPEPGQHLYLSEYERGPKSMGGLPLRHVLREWNQNDERYEPVVAVTDVFGDFYDGRRGGTYVNDVAAGTDAIVKLGSFMGDPPQHGWLALDGSKRYAIFSFPNLAIDAEAKKHVGASGQWVLGESEYRLSPDGAWLARMTPEGVLHVYAMDGLFETAE